MSNPNRMIVIEGIDGAGKSTIVERLAAELGAAVFKFPDRETPIGKLIYAHLDSKWAAHAQGECPPDFLGEPEPLLDATVFQALHTANRTEKAPWVLTARATGPVVIDRYWPTGVTYGAADGLDRDWLIKLDRANPQPDLFILLDIDLEHSLARRSIRRDRYEVDDKRMVHRIVGYRSLWGAMEGDGRSSFNDAWRNYGFQGPRPRWVTVDARGGIDAVLAAVLAAVGSAP